MKNRISGIIFLLTILLSIDAFAIETAPRISDREIIEGLSDIRGDIKELRAEIKGLEAGVKGDIKRLEAGQIALQQQIADMKWMFGLFITIALSLMGVALSLMGIMGRILWNQHKKMTQVETTLETQKDELSFIKGLVEKLLPPRGAL